MDAGYFSDTAVRDLLAVKDGEIDFLKRQIEILKAQCDSLSLQLHNQECTKCKT